MADPTLVNGQITDAVTQTDVMVLGSASAMAIGTLYQVTAQAIALSMQNAVANQQRWRRSKPPRRGGLLRRKRSSQ